MNLWGGIILIIACAVFSVVIVEVFIWYRNKKHQAKLKDDKTIDFL